MANVPLNIANHLTVGSLHTRGSSHARTHTHTHTHTRLTALFPGLPRWAGTRKGNQSGFYWSKRQWLAVASAGLRICKSAPSSRHTTMPASHNSVTFQSIKFQSYQTLQPHMTAYSSARMYSLICVIISNKWDLHSLSYLQGHSRLCVMWYPITSYKSSILTMPLSCTVSGILSYKQIIWAILHRTVDANIK